MGILESDDPFLSRIRARAAKTRARSAEDDPIQMVMDLVAERQIAEQEAQRTQFPETTPMASPDVPNFDRPGLGSNQGFTAPREAYPQPTVAGSGSLEQFINAIAKKESGSNYKAVGPAVKSGDRAYGKYQIMGANLPSWGKETVGRPLTAQEFLNSPELQEKVARAKLTRYFKKYGAKGAAKAWYGGEGAAKKNSDSANWAWVNGKKTKMPSLNDYASKF